MGKAFLAQDLTVEDASLVPDTCWYARSPKIRSPRPAHIEFKVGQVVEFTTKGYRGIVFGWDAKPHLGYDYELQVPEKYVDQDENVDSPCYMVMCDSVDAGADCVTYYVPQDQLKPSTCAVGVSVSNTTVVVLIGDMLQYTTVLLHYMTLHTICLFYVDMLQYTTV
eukprot:scpid81418/ scgid4994/ 